VIRRLFAKNAIFIAQPDLLVKTTTYAGTPFRAVSIRRLLALPML
jgi:hypothetical protein